MVPDPASGGHDEGPFPGLSGVAEAIHGKGRRRRVLVGLLASALTVLALALALEVFLRLTHDRERAFQRGVNRTLRPWVELSTSGIFEEIDDPVRRYAMRPGARCTVDGWLFRVSSHRTRGEDFPLEKPPGEKRLLMLGDSYCFGMWCDEDETLVAHLARMATERESELGTGIRWRPLNLGVPGYNTRQELRALRQDGLRLDPDAVVVYFGTNDLERPGFFYDEELHALRTDHLPLPIGLRRVLWSSHLYGFLARAYDDALKEAQPSPYLSPRVPYAWVREDNQRDTREALQELVALCRERGLPLGMVNQPLITWTGDLQRADWAVLPVVRWAEDVRAELGIPGVDLLGWARGNADGVDRGPGPVDASLPGRFLLERYVADEEVQGYFRGEGFEMPAEPDFHLTGEGYAHIARVAYPALRGGGVLP